MSTDLKLFKYAQAVALLDIRMRQNARMNKCGFPGTLAHARTVFEICYLLNKQGKQFYTEAVFYNGKGRADIFVIDNCTRPCP